MYSTKSCSKCPCRASKVSNLSWIGWAHANIPESASLTAVWRFEAHISYTKRVIRPKLLLRTKTGECWCQSQCCSRIGRFTRLSKLRTACWSRNSYCKSSLAAESAALWAREANVTCFSAGLSQKTGYYSRCAQIVKKSITGPLLIMLATSATYRELCVGCYNRKTGHKWRPKR